MAPDYATHTALSNQQPTENAHDKMLGAETQDAAEYLFADGTPENAQLDLQPTEISIKPTHKGQQ